MRAWEVMRKASNRHVQIWQAVTCMYVSSAQHVRIFMICKSTAILCSHEPEQAPPSPTVDVEVVCIYLLRSPKVLI